MKNKISLLLCAAACLLAACNKLPAELPIAEGSLTVDLSGISATKATTGTTAENTVGNLSLFVFDENGMLDLAHNCSATEIQNKKAVLRIKTGTKTVYAAANLNPSLQEQASAVCRLSDLEALAYALSDNAPGGLVMRGSKSSVKVTTSSASTTVPLTRGVARVSLSSVKNSLPAPYGTVKLERAFLCNVVGNQNLKGDAAPDISKYVNQEATRGHVKSQVIGTGSVEAECPELTFKTLGESVASGKSQSYTNKFFYGFPNALKTPNNGFNATFTPTATVLMVVVTIKDIPYYYPVPLSGGLAANTEYKVDLTLAGLGNTEDDPFARIQKGELSVSVSVSAWTTGTGISETI